MIKKLFISGCILVMLCSCAKTANELNQQAYEAYGRGDYSTAFELFTKAAEQENTEACRNLGQLYAEGKGVNQSAEKAVEYYGKAIEGGDSIAILLLAECYENGNVVNKDIPKMLSLYEKSVEMGNNTVCGKIANIYFRGIGTDVDYQKAVNMAKKGLELNDPTCQAIIGFFMMEGNYGIKQNTDSATVLLKAALDGESALGMALLGTKCLSEDTKRGLDYIEKAIQEGEPFGLYARAYGYYLGYPRASFQTAHKYYQEAADKGCVRAIYSDGELLESCLLQPKGAFGLYEKAAERGDADAISMVGYMYLNGIVRVKKSEEKSFEYFQKAAEKGSHLGYANLGWCYETGQGVDKNKEKAIEYYEKAIEQGDPWYSQKRLQTLKK
ncbi:MAG: sel1 repeat family protein [Muribaculaceae bacterium]|nr:sel1 repeat family protein [Muribaculaceae bacterium]